MIGRTFCVFALALPALAQTTFTASVRNRLEAWDWFQADSGDHSYVYNGSTIRFGVTTVGRKLDWTLELEAPLLLHLPTNSVIAGPQGQLGQGASYFAANHSRQNAFMLFPKQAFLKWKGLGSDHAALRLGRFEFQDGSELPGANASLAQLKRERIQQRLLGPFGFTHVMRSFDGLEYSYSTSKLNHTFIAATPTRGVFQVDGWGWLKTAFAYGSTTRRFESKSKTALSELRLFALEYRDWRHVVKADNRSAAARASDFAAINIQTFGAHYVSNISTHAGQFDLVSEAAIQTGKWGSLDHRASMYNLEAGLQPKAMRVLNPWFRAGYYHGSGDSNPTDSSHGTFFQILPTPRPYAQYPFYNGMNNVDRFATLMLRPHKRVAIKSEAHSLRLANRADLWYLGGGAFQPWTFGYQSKSAAGALSLANLYSNAVEVTVNPHFTFSPYFGYAQGKSAIKSVYPKGPSGHLAFLEFTYRY